MQFDTTRVVPSEAEFVATHACLDASIPMEHLSRGFWIFGLEQTWDYESAAADLLSDPDLNRALPVYMTLIDSAEFKVTDLIDVQFNPDLPFDSAIGLLESAGLSFGDSSAYRHNLWQCALHDTIKESPLAGC